MHLASSFSCHYSLHIETTFSTATSSLTVIYRKDWSLWPGGACLCGGVYVWCVHRCACACMHMWKPQADVECLPQLSSPYFSSFNLVCLCKCLSVPQNTCGGQGQLPVLSFYHVGAEDQTRLLWFGSKLFYPLNHPLGLSDDEVPY